MFLDMMKKCRSCRRFDNNYQISDEVLNKIMECVRFAPTGGNLQTLRYFVTNKKDEVATIFAQTKWAALFKDWNPAPHEQPTAFIIICTQKSLEARRPYLKTDVGIAAQTIMLAASSENLSGCMLGSFNEPNLCELLNLTEDYHIELVVALGKAAESITYDDAQSPENLAYYRDENDVHHVPKLTINNLIIKK